MSSQRNAAREARPDHTNLLLVVWIMVFLVVGLFGSYKVYTGVREAVAGWETTGPFQPNPTRRPDAPTPVANEVVLPDWQGKERVNILLLGIDQREIEQGPWRTDTMILVTIDPATKSAGMLSIPRDLWVPIPGYEESRINNAHFMGDATNYPGGGPALAKKTVQYNFGLPVHYYVRLNFTAFEKLLDLIGGIDVQVERAIDDPEYPNGTYGFEPFHIEAGLQHMDGKTALKYARSRHDDPLGDFGRAHRQQQVILAIRDRVLKANVIPQLLPRAGEIVSTLGDAVQTDLSLQQVLALAKLGSQIDRTRIKQAYIDQTMTLPFETPDKDQVLIPLRDEMRKVVASLLEVPPTANGTALPPEPAARVVVQNGTVTAGLAGQTAEALKSRGFNVVQYGNTDDNRSDYDQTQILVYTGRTVVAQALADALQVPVSAVRPMTNASGDMDIKVILGADYRVIGITAPAPLVATPVMTTSSAITR
jgi:polyisoprenyl-teichoic acid--peptidoglycan teichoic acid transferase